MSHSSDETRAASARQVAVTVTTMRNRDPGWAFDWIRRSAAEGDFAATVRAALAERLGPEGLHQVLGRILARPPAAEQAIEYEGSFSPLMHLVVLVHPRGCDGTEPGARVEHIALQGLQLADGK